MKKTRRAMLVSTAAALVTARMQQAQAAFNIFSAASQGPQGITPPTLFFTAAPGSTHVTSSTATTTLTFGDCPAGNTVVAHINAQASGTIASLRDSAGNTTYARAAQAVGTATHDCELWYVSNCLHIPAGSTFTATTVAGGTYTISGAIYFPTANTLDQIATLDLASSSGFTLTTPPLSSAVGVAVAAEVDGVPTSYTEDPNWTALLGNPTSSVAAVDFAYQMITSAAAVSWSPSFSATTSGIDAVIATFKVGGTTPVGTGLSGATTFLPSDLPIGGQTAGGAATHWHLTARPWTALNVLPQAYLTRAKNQASYWITQLNANSLVIDPYQGTTAEDDRGKVPYAIGTLITAGQSTAALNTGGMNMLGTNTTGAISVYQAGNSPDFFIEPMFDAIPMFTGVATPTQITNWYAGMDRFLGAGPGGNNWFTYDMNGIWSTVLARTSHGATLTSPEWNTTAAAIANIEAFWNTQFNTLGVFANTSPWNVYQDGNGPPDSLSIDFVGRINLMNMIGQGYNGASAAQIDNLTRVSALTALLTQDPTGQVAAGGRQNTQCWVDAAAQVTHEIMAQKLRASNPTLAGQFQRAAMMAFNTIERWQNPQHPGTYIISKNRFNPASLIGAQGTYQFMYNLDITQFAAMSYLYRNQNPNITEVPAPTEIGGYALTLNSNPANQLKYAFANAGGTSVEIVLAGQNGVQDGEVWTVPGIARIGRVGWETRLFNNAGYSPPSSNQVSFAPTWFTAGNWTRLAGNPTTVTGTFTTTFASPALTLAQVVWSAPGGITFTQNLTITPDGVMVQTTQTGSTPGNWGVTFPLLANDGDLSPNTWGASTMTQAIGVTPGIASTTWPGTDTLNFITITGNTATLTPEASCQTASGNVTPVRSVVTADSTHTTFVYPQSSSDPSGASVQSSFAITGPNTFTCTALGITVVSSAATGTYYIGRTSAGGWAQTFTTSGGTVSFTSGGNPTPCNFIAQLSNGVVSNLEVDRAVTAIVQSNAPANLVAYTPRNFTPTLPTGLLQSTPLGQGAFTVIYQEAGSAASANGDGSTGWQTPSSGPQLSGWTVLQMWWTAPASQYYQFKIPAHCAAFTANPANSIAVSIDQVPAQYDGGTTSNNNWFMAFVSNTGASIEYSFTAAVAAGVHSILLFLCNGAHYGTGALNNVTHFDRLNIYGTGTALPAEPAGSRNPALQPYSSYHFMNVPFGANAQFRALNDPVSQTLNGTGGNGASVAINANNFSTNVWIGGAADPVWSLTNPDNIQVPTSPVSTPIPCRAPAGSYPSNDSTDLNVAFIDGTNPRYAYGGIEWFQNGPRTANYDFGIIDSYNLNHGVPQSFGNFPGLIRTYDLDNGVIAHRLLGHMGFGNPPSTGLSGFGPAIQTTQNAGMPWPACQSDSAWHQANEYNNPNGVPYGAVAGILPGTAKPGGLNAATSMMWDCLAHYGVWFNVTGGTYPIWGIYAEGNAQNHPALTGISWSTILPHLSVMTNASQAPIVVGQGLGGGAPVVPLAPGITQGYPSIGQSPYTFPTSPVGIPLQIAHSNLGIVLPSGTATNGTFGATVPTGSLVLLFLSLDRAASVNFNTPVLDSRGNSYTIINSPASGSTWHPAIAYCPATTALISSGTTWTLTLSPTGVSNYYSLGAYYRPPPPSGSTFLRSSNSAVATSGVTALSTTLAGVQTGDLIIGFALTSSYAEIANPSGMGSIDPTPPISIGFQVASAPGPATFNYNPTWNFSSAAAVVAAAFANANIAT